MDLSTRFSQIQEWLNKYSILWQQEPLNYFPNEYPDEIKEIITPLLELSDKDLLQLENSWSLAPLDSFFKTRNELLEIPTWTEELDITKINQVGMSSKKRHEIKRIGAYIIKALKQNDHKTLIDIGAGVGHLAFTLFEENNEIQTFVIDRDQRLVSKGTDKAKRKLKEKRAHIQFKTLEISENNYPKMDLLKGCLNGLHSCGDLSLHLMDWYLKSHHQDLILTSCCYHQLSKYNLSRDAKLDISRHALHLAAKGDNYQEQKDYDRRLKVKEKRYALELYYRNKFNKPLEPVGSIPFTDYQTSFAEYARAMTNLDLPINELNDFFNDQQTKKNIRLLLIQGIIRGAFSKPLEMYLALDRALYLKEQGIESKLISLFDREFSPRNITLIAHKN